MVLSMALGAVSPALGQNPPLPPIITEPPLDGTIVSAEDAHMETAPMNDPDGDGHFCTDWEIWLSSPSERVWSIDCITGVEIVHVHLGDGTFEGSHAGRHSLLFEADYRLVVRHRDDTGEWSPYSERLFSTGPQSQVFPMELHDVLDFPVPSWQDEVGASIFLPGGTPPGSLLVESAAAALLLEIHGLDGSQNGLVNPAPLPEHVSARVRLAAGSAALILPASRLAFTDDDGTDRTIFLPALNLAPGNTVYLWISENGSSYWGNAGQTEPDFSDLAAGAPVPWQVVQPGYRVEVVARGFQLPVNIAFVPNPGPDPDDPVFYVTELYGTIKVVLRDGTVGDYATDLLNFDPTGNFPGSGEQGLAGIVVDPATGDIYAGMLYDSAPPNGPHYPKVVRFTSVDGGLTAATQTTILDMVGEIQGQSHFISNFSLGPDGKLYVHMGDGFDAGRAQDLGSFRGKVLRMNLNGTAPPDNPLYNGAPITARDYIYALGFRNPFGGAWRAADGQHYEVENGPNSNDRFARVISGGNYGWDGSDQSMTVNAIYNWSATHAPVNIAFVQPSTFGGSGFPPAKQDHAFVTESGPTWALGPQERGKRIVEFVVGPNGEYVDGPNTLIAYNGSGRASACGLAAGPDGLYFTDLYKDENYESPIDRGANVLRVRYVGVADFVASSQYGLAPFTVDFQDLSDVPGAVAWSWNFGDGGTSTDRNPEHTYAEEGVYSVRLEVTGDSGIVQVQKVDYIVVGYSNAIGLRADYYDALNFDDFAFTRIDPMVDFNWGLGSPDGGMGPDQFSVRWTGEVLTDFSETYTFYTISDDGIRLWVNQQLVVDSWIDQPPTEHQGTIDLFAGRRYTIKVEFYENGGGAVARLHWSSPSLPRQAVPQSHLFPAFPAGVDDPGHEAEVRLALEPMAAANPLRAPGLFAIRARDGGPMRLALHDLAGREVARLFDGYSQAGRPVEIRLDPSHLPAGVYFLRLEGAGRRVARKLTVLR
jgi:glucose/arabinose dehydrogenase